MKIKIQNFRSIEDKEIELPNTGLIRIGGDSGAGKSTFLDGISWGLYGEAVVKSVKPLTGSKKPVVNITFRDMRVMRQNSPNRLLIESNQYENEAAQAFIDTTLGMNADIFQACSYIKQKLKGSLLSFSPAEQLRFVQKIAFGADDPEIHKAKISAMIKEIEGKIKTQASELTLLAEMAQTAKTAQEAAELRLSEQKKPIYTADERLFLFVDADTIRQKYKDAEKNFNEKKKSLEDTKDATRDLQNVINNLENALSEHTKNLIEQKSDLNSLEPPDEKYTAEKIKAAYSLIQAQTVWLAKSTEAVKKLQKIQNIVQKHGEIKNIEKTIDKLTTESFEQENQLRELEEKKYHAEISSKKLPCPHCNQSVIFSNNNLIKAHDHKGISLVDIKKEIDAVKAVKNKIDAECTSLVHLHRELKRLQAETTELGPAPLPAAQTQEQLNQFQEKIKVIEISVSMYNFTKSSLETEIQKLEDNIAKTKASLSDNQPKLDALMAEGRAIYKEWALAQIELDNCATDVAELKERLQVVEIDEIYEKQLKQAQQDVEKSIERAKEAQGKYEAKLKSQLAAENKLKKALKLKELSDAAATQSVADILSSINAHAKAYTELLFPNQGTTITLNNVRLNKDESVRAKMSTSVFHKGVEYDSLDQLSGGEQNRAMLAFQLALSDLFNSPILLLDEAFAGAHTELKNDCIESLRSVASRKLVIIVEHGLDDGLFDEVIYV
jgi:DNA repair exonuclease SbcCD ATPase subunit